MDHENDKQVIYLKDLIFAVLYRWRILLTAILAGAVLLGGFQFFQNKKADSAAVSAQVSESIQRQEQQVAAKQNAVKNQESYLRDSFLQNMDPYNVYQVSASFYVHTDYQILPGMQYQNPDPTPALLNAYHTMLRDNRLSQKVAEAVGIDAKYVPELITSELTSTGIPGVLTVTAIHSDSEKANQIISTVRTYLESAAEDIQSLGAHKLSVTVISSGLTTSQNVITLQKQASEQLNTLNTELSKLNTQLDQLQSSSSPRSFVLMAVIGAILGAVVVAGIFMVRHIGSNKIYSSRILTNRTGICVISRIGTQKRCSPIDRWLKKLDDRPGRDQDGQIAVAAAYLANVCGENDRLLLTGDCDREQLASVAQALSGAGLQVCAQNGLLWDSQAVKALSDCSAVVLVEQCEHSLYRNVAQEMAMLQALNKPMLGCILLDR